MVVFKLLYFNINLSAKLEACKLFLHLLIPVNTQLLFEMEPKFCFRLIMQVFSEGYICIAYANGIL